MSHADIAFVDIPDTMIKLWEWATPLIKQWLRNNDFSFMNIVHLQGFVNKNFSITQNDHICGLFFKDRLIDVIPTNELKSSI